MENWKEVARNAGSEIASILAPIAIIAVGVAAWEFTVEGGIVKLLGGVSVAEFEQPNTLGVTTAPLQLHDNPPRRPVLFPFVLLDPKKSDTIADGTIFRVIEEQRRNDFLRESSTWLYVETLDGTKAGWISTPIEWFPIADNPTDAVRAYVAYLEWLREHQPQDFASLSATLEAFTEANAALRAEDRDPESER